MIELEKQFFETGWSSANKHNETLCGDYFKLFENENRKVYVLSDGLGSGVKANILSTLTATILGTMISRNMPLDECVDTVAAALPVCRVRRLAYSTFTVLQLERNIAYLVQYDNPSAIILRKGKRLKYSTQVHFVGEKEIHESRIPLQDEDVIILMTDGVINAGIGKLAPNGWKYEELVAFLERLDVLSMSASRIAASIVNGCLTLSENSMDDDTTVLTIKVRERNVVNILVGPPENKEEDNKIMKMFFAKNGTRIVCGGSTAHAVSKYLNKPLHVLQDSGNEQIPDMAQIDGVDYVTEGIITLKRVLEICNQYIDNPMTLLTLCQQKDAAALIAIILIEKATDINIYFGMAANSAHEGTDIDFQTKLAVIKQLEETLLSMHKNAKISFC
ncbi:MAG: SpoIIE family protein phosphatase [Herbinix sp.]|nr:SpoIIE family protein phosphatase [Herbinix sp.]